MTAVMLTGLITLLSAGAGAQSFESGHRKLPLSSLSQPAYEPTKQPTSGGRCSDDSSWEDGCTSSYTNWGPNEPNNDPDFGGEDCTIKRNAGTVWNDVPCDFTYPCYCQDVKGGGTR